MARAPPGNRISQQRRTDPDNHGFVRRATLGSAGAPMIRATGATAPLGKAGCPPMIAVSLGAPARGIPEALASSMASLGAPASRLPAARASLRPSCQRALGGDPPSSLSWDGRKSSRTNREYG